MQMARDRADAVMALPIAHLGRKVKLFDVNGTKRQMNGRFKRSSNRLG